MTDDSRHGSGQFKIAYHHDNSAAGYAVGNDLQHKFIMQSSSKRAVSSKKVRGKQKKNKTTQGPRNTMEHP